MKPDAIIFDSDGVLVDSEKIHIAVERELLSELGLDYESDEYVSRFVGLNLSDYYAALERDFKAKFNQPFPTDFGARLYQRVWPRIQSELEPVPDVTAILEVHAGPSAVASSAPTDRLREKLAITACSVTSIRISTQPISSTTGNLRQTCSCTRRISWVWRRQTASSSKTAAWHYCGPRRRNDGHRICRRRPRRLWLGFAPQSRWCTLCGDQPP